MDLNSEVDVSSWWVYKCNAQNREYQAAYGNWEEVFRSKRPVAWGETTWVPQLSNLQPGDRVLAYQTDRNELVGVAEVVELRAKRGEKEVWLRPTQRIGVPVRPLKASHPEVAEIPAFKPGPVKTLYAISDADVAVLLRAAGAADLGTASSEEAEPMVEVRLTDPEHNRQVERAAVEFVKAQLRSENWDIDSTEDDGCGYDLGCRRGGAELHVEVKGTAGEGNQFVLTAKEHRCASKDPLFELFLVSNALSATPRFERWTGTQLLKAFDAKPVAYIARRRSVQS
jgi:hypothetical protein